MKRKLHSWMILKLSSARLKRKKYNIKITLSQARANNEMIKIGENELLSAVQRVLGKQVRFDRIDEIGDEKKRVGRLKNSDINRAQLISLREELDDIAYISEVVAVQFDDKRHYENIRDTGLYINGVEYVRLLAGAGNIRRNTVLFVDKSLYEPLMDVLNNGRNEKAKLNPAKFSAYLGLYVSAGHSVSTPSFEVIKDCEIRRSALLNWIDTEDNVSVEEKEISLNAFDGQGLISPNASQKWAEGLGLDYIPSAYIIRAPFAKGQVVTFDFQSFAETNGTYLATDIWGNQFDIRDTDVILSESQFKLWDSYNSVQEYRSKCLERELGFRVLRYTPKVLRSDTTANYMFLQVLEPEDDDIDELIQDTLEYFGNIRVDNHLITSLYLAGSSAFPPDFNSEMFDNLDIIPRAVLGYPPLLKEKYISQRIKGTLKKKEKDALLGKVLSRGNYSPLVSDPFAQAQHLCGLEVTGLLSEDETFSDYWYQLDIDKVASARPPLTHNSEMRESNIVSNVRMRMWYKYLDTTFILPAMGLDTLYYADADFDGDLICTTDSEVMMRCRQDGLPVAYEHGKAEKIDLSPDVVSKSDIDGFGSKIGFITNTSSTYHCLIHEFPVGSPERKEIERRLMLLRLFQGEEIDGAKNGGVKRKIPLDWSKFDRDSSLLTRNLLSDRRPLFTRHLYDRYKRKYLKELEDYENYAWNHFGKSFEEILSCDERTGEEQRIVDEYYKYSFFIFADSPMNRISARMEEELKEIDVKVSSEGKFDYSQLLSKSSVEPDADKLELMMELFSKYVSTKKAWRSTRDEFFKKDIFSIIIQIGNEAREKISSNSEELGDLAVSVMMKDSRARSFAWAVFGDEILENVLNRHGREIDILTKDDNGEVQFMFERYRKKRVYI